ncbi:daunorubicin resistance protein DrrA family ABC transporter ATP-binding protein [Methanoregula formicica]|uniref:Daunorubicin resistance ABC transporter ATP-binding subunit n=1 Tax=Methanoregula formicica (strain DSM 22288 / NBRC 105244 / SMSP) TaxID=593750 RepID=L0HDS1_METFS|nr:daunorubicin resistance protein DrrA family ABC transporter ATP-binding protein [Methanoregula formicica]AGB01941.1 daunorubicin resistance ABC transporter ATP-binding subunit [Methanoregula formicica SMSP]
MNLIETYNLTKYYGDLCAVDHLTLSVNNEIFALLGPNGSGKTTTVLMLTTLLGPSEGRAEVCGFDILKEGEQVRKSLSYVPQDMAVDIKLTGRENVRFFADLYGVPDAGNRVDEVLAVMELTDRADDLIRTYSGGMRRRLELAQALVHEPKVLFLDEPTIGLDVAARKKIWEHIQTLRKKGMTIFVTTHYMDEADQFCDRVGIISKGRIAALGAPKELKARLMKDVITAKVEGTFVPPELEGIVYLGSNNDEVSFTAENGQEALPALADALGKSGGVVRSMSLREPTLDDVFIQAVGQQEESHGFDYNKFRIMLRRRK